MVGGKKKTSAKKTVAKRVARGPKGARGVRGPVGVAAAVPEYDEALHERLSRIEDTLSSLLEALTAKPEGEERKLKPTPALTKAMMEEKAFRARQAKWAKRMGLTRAQFIKRYGDTDQAPPNMPKVRYRKKAKPESSASS